MDIGFKSVRHIVIDYVGDAVYIDTTRRDISRYKHSVLSTLKAVERALALCLRQIPLERRGWNTIFLQSFAEAFGHMLHLRENDHY